MNRTVASLFLATAAVSAVDVAAQTPSIVSPVAHPSGVGAGANWYPFGTGQIHYQQVHSAGSFSVAGPQSISSLSVRPSRIVPGVVLDMELVMAASPHGAEQADSVFANNVVPGTEVVAVTRKSVSLPNTAGGSGWDIALPFDQVFPWSGGHVSWFMSVHGNNQGNTSTYFSAQTLSGAGIWRQTGGFAGCASALGTQPAEQSVRLYSPGQTSRFTGLSYVPTGGLPAVLNVGLSETSIGSVPLPFDLTGIGGMGCSLTQDVRATMLGTTNMDPEGRVTFDVPIPADDRLSGATFYTQIAFLQPGANSLGVFLSPGATNTIGANHGATRVFGSYGVNSGTPEIGYGIQIGLN